LKNILSVTFSTEWKPPTRGISC